VVRFVSYAPVKHSSCFNNLNNLRFRFVIEWFLGELWSDMHRWWSRKSCTTTTENSESKLDILVCCFSCSVSFDTLLSNILCVLIISTTFVSDILWRYFSESYGRMCKVGCNKYHVQPRPKTRNPSRIYLFSASAVPFRSTRS
jgi:hypothetical protein